MTAKKSAMPMRGKMPMGKAKFPGDNPKDSPAKEKAERKAGKKT